MLQLDYNFPDTLEMISDTDPGSKVSGSQKHIRLRRCESIVIQLA